MFTSQTRLLSQINAARATNTLERKLQTLARVPLLIIDLCAVFNYVKLWLCFTVLQGFSDR